jgi:hypothetical protein
MSSIENTDYVLYRIALNVSKVTGAARLPTCVTELSKFFFVHFPHVAVVTTEGEILCHEKQFSFVTQNFIAFLDTLAAIQTKTQR